PLPESGSIRAGEVATSGGPQGATSVAVGGQDGSLRVARPPDPLDVEGSSTRGQGQECANEDLQLARPDPRRLEARRDRRNALLATLGLVRVDRGFRGAWRLLRPGAGAGIHRSRKAAATRCTRKGQGGLVIN